MFLPQNEIAEVLRKARAFESHGHIATDAKSPNTMGLMRNWIRGEYPFPSFRTAFRMAGLEDGFVFHNLSDNPHDEMPLFQQAAEAATADSLYFGAIVGGQGLLQGAETAASQFDTLSRIMTHGEKWVRGVCLLEAKGKTGYFNRPEFAEAANLLTDYELRLVCRSEV